MNKAQLIRIGFAVALLISATSQPASTGTEDLVDQQNRLWQPTAPAVQFSIWPEGL